MLRHVSFLLCVGGLMAFDGFAYCAQASEENPLDQWHWRNPLPQGNPLDNVVFCNGTFFALGPQGTLVTSPNGIAWTASMLETAENLGDIAWARGRYVLVGSGGLVLTSTDAVNWSPRPSGTFANLLAITYGQGIFIAVGDRGTILTSADGSNWIRRATGGTMFRDVAFNGSQFMIVGYDEADPVRQGSVYTSTDGVLWSRRNPPFDGRFSGVAARDSLFVVVGGESNILSSPDGSSWFSQGTEFVRLRSVTRSASLFVAVGDSTVLASPDGYHWTDAASFPTDAGHGLLGTAYGNGRYVAVGGQGIILSSPNAVQWNNQTSASIDSTLRGFAFGGAAYVAVGDHGTILGSNDGQHWQARDSGTTGHLTRVVYGAGLHVAVGPPHRILTSSDGVNWASRDSGVDEVLLDLAFGAGRFVAVGIDGSVLMSTNGIDWTRQATVASGLNGIAWSGELFLAVGNWGALVTSSDGITWTPRSTGRAETLSSIAAGNGLYVAVGDYGMVLTSSNLNQWSAQSVDSSLFLRHVQYGQGRFVVAGFSLDGLAEAGHILNSTDGRTWKFDDVPAVATPLTAVGFAAGSFFVVGDRGTILQCDSLGEFRPVLSLGREGGGCPTLTVAGIIGRTYRIESTSVMTPNAVWQSRTNLTLEARVSAWTDPQCARGPALIYRAVVVPNVER